MTPEERQELEQRRALKAQQPQQQGQDASGLGGLEALGQGLSMGFQDEMRAGLQSILPYGNSYEQELASVRRQQQGFDDRNPILSPALKLGGNLISGIATGGAGGSMLAREAFLGALEGYGSNEDRNRLWTDLAMGGGLGAVASKFGSLFGRSSASERVASGISEIAERAERKAGARLITRGQRTGSQTTKNIERMGENLPLVGKPTKNIKQNYQTALNKAAAKGIGLPGATELTPDILNIAEDSISNRFTQAIGSQDIPISDEFVDTVVDAVDSYNSMPGATDKINKLGSSLFDELDKPMTAERYQSLSSYLGQKMKGAKPEQIPALASIKNGLDDMVEAGLGGETLDQFKIARKQWKNLKALTSGVNTVGVEGDVSGKLLYNQLARGGKAHKIPGTELGDLATLSKVVDNVGSNTTEKMLPYIGGGMLATGAATGAVDVSGVALGGLLTGRALNTLAQNSPIMTEGAGSAIAGAIQRTAE